MKPRRVKLANVSENTCPQCAHENIETRTFGDTVDFRGLELDVEGLQDSKCGNCGYTWISEKQLNNNSTITREAYAVARDELRAEYGLLSGDEIARIREQLKLNKKNAAALFGGGSNAFNKYESGEVLQSFAMDRLIRLAKIIGAPIVEFLADVNAPPPFKVIPATSGGFTTMHVVGHISLGPQMPMSVSVRSTGNLAADPLEVVRIPNMPFHTLGQIARVEPSKRRNKAY